VGTTVALLTFAKAGMPGQFENFGAHALKGGEKEQGEADHEGGHEGLLPGQGFGDLMPKVHMVNAGED
jgi:hypothetical protein